MYFLVDRLRGQFWDFVFILFQDLFVDFGIQFPLDRSDDPVLIKCVYVLSDE